MSFNPRSIRSIILTVSLLALANVAAAAPSDYAQRVFKYWTPERVASAQPRDLVIDERGLAYLRLAGGKLVPYGHDIKPNAKPVNGDTTPPTIDSMSPAAGAILTSESATFSARVTDTSGVKSVQFVLVLPSGSTQSFNPALGANNTWSVLLSGFTDGSYGWYVVAKDNATRGGNQGVSDTVNFTVSLGSGGGGGGGGTDPVITNSHWTGGGAVLYAAGRIIFEMPTNGPNWGAYVCSGTVATDTATDRSVIITAAHCVYDDSKKVFARNVMFIPNQDGTSGTATDWDCSNDPIGCWAPSFGAVDVNWTTRVFPDNIEWDYAYYVVSPTGAHSGPGGADLEAAAGSLPITFATPALGSYTHGMGYSYDDDPLFMYCAEGLSTEGAVNWWLPSCGMSGGSSGGPWMNPFDASKGTGSIMSVNSWGYTSSPGMAGPQLDRTAAKCVFDAAQGASMSSTGVVANCP